MDQGESSAVSVVLGSYEQWCVWVRDPLLSPRGHSCSGNARNP
jgi:hypothetical protein